MDQPGDVAKIGRPLYETMHRMARRRVNHSNAHIVSGIGQNLCRSIGVVLPHIGQQDVLTNANAARDCLTNLTGSNDDIYISHSFFLSLYNIETPTIIESIGKARHRPKKA
jgi:hypothetical protein